MISFDSLGQKDRDGKQSFANGYTYSASLGATHYWGDLRDASISDAIPFQEQSKVGIGLSVQRPMLNVWDIGLRALFTNLKSNDVNKIATSLDTYSFSTNLLQIGLNINVDVISVIKQEKENDFGVIGMGGIGVNAYNSQAIVRFPDGSSAELTDVPVVESPGMNVAPVAFYGLGCRYRYTRHWMISLESTYYFLDRDNLDGWSDDRSVNDSYSYTALALGYTFSKKEDKFKRKKMFD